MIIIVQPIRFLFFCVFFAGRADALGKLGVSYAIGMVIGPFVGGLITKKYGEQSAAFFAATFSFISIIISLLFIPRNTKALSPQEKSAEKLEASELMNLVLRLSLGKGSSLAK